MSTGDAKLGDAGHTIQDEARRCASDGLIISGMFGVYRLPPDCPLEVMMISPIGQFCLLNQ